MHDKIIQCDVTGESVYGKNSHKMVEVKGCIPGYTGDSISCDFHVHKDQLDGFIPSEYMGSLSVIHILYSGCVSSSTEKEYVKPIGFMIKGKYTHNTGSWVSQFDRDGPMGLIQEKFNRKAREKHPRLF